FTPEPVAEAVPVESPAVCPHCGEDVPDPRNRVCVECHHPLTLAEPVRLSFPSGEVTIDATQAVPLGRDPASSPVAGLFADRDNISRLHATVGVDAHGAWVRDENSLNGTYVNDVPVPPGSRIGLTEGDTLRLAADVTATVRMRDATGLP
ncbi:MAG: FHA domain-containing protein, partial [Pseudonocardiaceae bacterium]